jgi:hypothetical protein
MCHVTNRILRGAELISPAFLTWGPPVDAESGPLKSGIYILSPVQNTNLWILNALDIC